MGRQRCSLENPVAGTGGRGVVWGGVCANLARDDCGQNGASICFVLHRTYVSFILPLSRLSYRRDKTVFPCAIPIWHDCETAGRSIVMFALILSDAHRTLWHCDALELDCLGPRGMQSQGHKANVRMSVLIVGKGFRCMYSLFVMLILQDVAIIVKQKLIVIWITLDRAHVSSAEALLSGR